VSGTSTDPKPRFVELCTVLFVFFVSGASGLIYEVVWTRMLTLVFGGTVFAVSAVLTSFMLGLGIGSLLGGRYADRVLRRRSLLVVYAVLEIAIAVLAVATPFLFSILDSVHVAVLSHSDPSRFQVVLLRFCLSLSGILLPTILMGATLPILSRYLVTRREHTGLRIGLLYSINTAGAVVGCFLSGFVLIASFGVATTLYIAAAGNLAAGILALLAARWTAAGVPNDNGGTSPITDIETSGHSIGSKLTSVSGNRPVLAWRPGLLIAVSALSGFTSLAYQVMWTRDFALIFLNTVYSFTVVVGTFLVGLVLGAMIASAIADRVRNTLTVLTVLQVLIGVTAIFLIDHERRNWLRDVIASSAGFEIVMESWVQFMMLRFLTALVTMLLPATLIGGTFPLLIRIYSRERGRLGCSVGELYCANTIGCVLGASVAGFVMIPLLGIDYSVVTIGMMSVTAGIVLALLDPLSSARRRLILISIAVVLAGTVIGLLDPRQAKTVYQNSQILFARDSIDGHVQIEQPLDSTVRGLTINYTRKLGGSSSLALRLQRRQGHLPMLLHPNPQDVLVIGFATGSTSGTVTLHKSMKSIDGVEIVACLEETAAYFSESNYNVIDDPRFEFHAEDGRNFVRTTSKKYDVIIVDLFQAQDAGIGNLYTVEHFQSCRNHLKPGGLICQWIPSDQLPKENFRTFIATFQHVFPHSTLWMADIPSIKGIVGIVGTVEPLRIDFPQLSSRFADESLATALAEVYLEDEFSVLSSFLLGSSDLQRLAGGAPLNTDDRPRIEFMTPRGVPKQSQFALINFSAVAHRFANGLHHADYIADRVDDLCPENDADCESASRLKARVEARSQIIRGMFLSAQDRVDETIACFKKAQAACPDSREVNDLAKEAFEILNRSSR